MYTLVYQALDKLLLPIKFQKQLTNVLVAT
jgi:hypothetical protein